MFWKKGDFVIWKGSGGEWLRVSGLWHLEWLGQDVGKTSQVALVIKNPPATTGVIRDVGSISGLGSSPGVGDGYPLQYSCLENPMDRGGWWATVYRVAKSQIWLRWLHAWEGCRQLGGWARTGPLGRKELKGPAGDRGHVRRHTLSLWKAVPCAQTVSGDRVFKAWIWCFSGLDLMLTSWVFFPLILNLICKITELHYCNSQGS